MKGGGNLRHRVQINMRHKMFLISKDEWVSEYSRYRIKLRPALYEPPASEPWQVGILPQKNMLLLGRACGWLIDEPGLLSLMVLVLIGRGILANRRGRMNNELLIQDL